MENSWGWNLISLIIKGFGLSNNNCLILSTKLAVRI
jgi:hypothetical protein